MRGSTTRAEEERQNESRTVTTDSDFDFPEIIWRPQTQGIHVCFDGDLLEQQKKVVDEASWVK